MIVTCSRCQARFRVADDKVGPRGAKVRCSRCQNVFAVHQAAAEPPPEAAPVPAPPPARPPVPFDLDLTPGIDKLRPPGEFQGAGAAADPFAPDPFAAAGLDTFAAEPGAGSDDPFARVAGLAPSPAGADDPFAPAALAAAEAAPRPGPAVDPFALVGAMDPFTPPAQSGGTGSLPVTDLSQLLGASGLATSARAAPSAPRSAPPPAADALADLSAPASGAGADLALEERTGPPPVPFADPEDVFAAVNVLPSDPGEAPRAAPVPFSADDSPLALATEPTPGPELAPRAPAAPSPAPELPAPAPSAEPADPAADGAGDAHRRAQAVPERRLRTVAVNALSLVALLAITLGFRAAWRRDAGAGAGLLGLSGLVGAQPATEDGPYRVSGVRAGTYELASGEAAVFVRGELLARPGAGAGPVRVRVELVRDGQVLASADGVAGAIPTPEEVYTAQGEAGRAALAAALEKRATRATPGTRVPFLVVVGEAPSDLAGTVVRVRATAEGGP